jgi:4-amino-4-deoxy-L-arabinose transferase-like glycosyltransferase
LGEIHYKQHIMSADSHHPWSVRLTATTLLVLLGIILLALVLRIWAVDFGLPYLYHPDEPDKIVTALRMLKTGDLNPHYFKKPSLFLYLNTLAYVPYSMAVQQAGVIGARADIPEPTMLAMGVGIEPLPSVVLVSRLMSVFFGTAAVAVCFWAAWRLTSRSAAGLLAAALLAVSPTCVMNSRYIAPESLLTFLLLLTLGASAQIWQRGQTRYYVLAGLAAGLTAASKYNGALVVLVIIAAHFLREGRSGWRKRNLYLAIGLSAVGFVAATPYAILDFSKFIADFSNQAQAYSTGHFGMEGNTFAWYLSYLWLFEGPVVVLAVIQVIRGVFSRSRAVLLVSVFPVAYFVFVNLYVVRNDRLILPLLPFLFILAAMLAVDLFDQLKLRAFYRPWVKWIIGVGLILVMIFPLAQTVYSTTQFAAIDSRETARVWIDQNLPPGSKIALESYAPYIDPGKYTVQGFLRIIDHPVAWYADNGYEYIVVSEGMFGRFFLEPERYAAEVAQYEELFQTLEPVRLFTDGGYDMRIYRISTE